MAVVSGAGFCSSVCWGLSVAVLSALDAVASDCEVALLVPPAVLCDWIGVGVVEVAAEDAGVVVPNAIGMTGEVTGVVLATTVEVTACGDEVADIVAVVVVASLVASNVLVAVSADDAVVDTFVICDSAFCIGGVSGCALGNGFSTLGTGI